MSTRKYRLPTLRDQRGFIIDLLLVLVVLATVVFVLYRGYQAHLKANQPTPPTASAAP